MRTVTEQDVENYKKYLIEDEKSSYTVEKYLSDVRKFRAFLKNDDFGKAEVIAYKAYLAENYAVSSANTAISSLNSFFGFMGWYELRLKSLKTQHRIFASDEKELSKHEYEKLLCAAKESRNQSLYFLMQTICATGIRVSELRFITVDAVAKKRAEISCKGKRRSVFLPDALCRMLKGYIKEKKIKSGPVFVTKNGNPLDRSNIWSAMKKLCRLAGVSEQKVFPHNLRHLFARTYYTAQKDIVRLADILGHSSINTTRIYTSENGEIHRRQIQKLGLLLC